jgi:apolipoprotein N-acyltransferase
MTVFRAVENRVPLVRSANTGISAIIDSRGHIHAMTELFTEALLNGKVKIGEEKSFYTRYGDIFAWFCICALAAIFVVRFVNSRRRSCNAKGFST